MALRAHLLTVLVAAASASAAVSVREFEPTSRVDVRSSRGEGHGPVAWIVTPPGPRAAVAEASATATTALALASLAGHELDELRAALETLASRLEARANPFGDDLDDGPPGEAMAAVRRSLAPALTAAHHLVTRTQTSADGTFAIVLGASCDEAPARATCFPLWRGESSGHSGGSDAQQTFASAELRARAAFFAWPIASAAVVRFADAKQAATLLEALRDRARIPGSRIALALDERALGGAADPRVDAICDAARSVVAHAGATRSSELEALRSLAAVPSRASAPPRRVPWLVLGSGEIMVVPKLGGLSDGAAFGHELDEVTLARGLEREARWIHRP